MMRSRFAAGSGRLFGVVAASLVLACPPSSAADPAPLDVEFVVSRPTSKEGGRFTVSLVVTNTGPDTITNVRPKDVAAAGTGAAALAKWPKPATATIRSGRSARFTLQFVATLRGDVELAAAATSDAGDSPGAASPQITIAPRRVGASATTTDLGDATIKVGRTLLPVRLRDERTGNPIAGLAVAFAPDKKVKSRGVVAVLDPLGRHPPQWFALTGPPTATKDSGPPTPVDLSVRVPCGDGEPLLRVVAPIETTALPPVKPPAVPPSPDVPADTEQSATFVAAVKAALAQAADAARGVGRDALQGGVRSGLLSRETVTCADAWQKDLDAIDALAQGELVGLVVDDPRPGLACGVFGGGAGACLGGVAALGTAEKVSQVVDRIRLSSFCPSPSRRDVISRYKIDLHLPPGLEFLDFDIYAHVGVATDSYASLIPLSGSFTDFAGLGLTSGSLELVSFTDPGLGIIAPLDGGGAVALDVPPGDYRWCVNSPGAEPKSGDVAVAGPGPTTIGAQLVPLAVSSVTLEADGLTGFLAEGTTRQMTATFRDAQGGVVDCTGRVRWYAVNPVGTIVATVNETTGLVTMQGGCGAALVIASCDGVSSVPGRLFSTDCDGSLPPKPPKPAGGGGTSALAVSISSASVAYVSSDASYHYYELTASGAASGPVGTDFLVVTYGGHPALATPIPPQYALATWGDRTRDVGELGTTTWTYTETLRTFASNPREFYDINVELYVGVTSHPASGDVERHATKTDGLHLN